MICRNDISNLKTDINDKIGQKIIVKGSLGRSKEFAKEGTIEKVYPNLFVVKYEENDRTASYTYTDLLTRTVEVDVFNGEDYSPLLPPVAVESKRRRMKEQLVQLFFFCIWLLKKNSYCYILNRKGGGQIDNKANINKRNNKECSSI